VFFFFFFLILVHLIVLFIWPWALPSTEGVTVWDEIRSKAIFSKDQIIISRGSSFINRYSDK
jgi:hypothetical protein